MRISCQPEYLVQGLIDLLKWQRLSIVEKNIRSRHHFCITTRDPCENESFYPLCNTLTINSSKYKYTWQTDTSWIDNMLSIVPRSYHRGTRCQEHRATPTHGKYAFRMMKQPPWLLLCRWWPQPVQAMTEASPSVRYIDPGPRLNIKTVFPRYRDSHVKDKTVSRPTVLFLTWGSYTGKTTSLYRDGPMWRLFCRL